MSALHTPSPNESLSAEQGLRALGAARSSKAELERFQQYLERCFAQLSTRLPDIYTTARELAQSLNGEQGSSLQGALDTVRASMQGLHQQVCGAARGIAVQNESIGATAIEIISCMQQLADCLKDVGRQGTRLRFTALNATIAAERAGAGAEAFGALTRSLSEVTNACIAEAKRASEMANETGVAVQRLDTLQLTVARELGETAKTCAKSLPEVERATVAQFETLLGNVERLGEGAGELLGPLREAIVGLQQQDILRQGLNHAVLLMERVAQPAEASLTPLGARDHLAFEVRAFELATQIVVDVRSQVDRHLLQLLDQTTQLETSALDLTVGSTKATFISDTELSQLFRPLHQTIDSLRRSLARLREYDSSGHAGKALLASIRRSIGKFSELSRQLGMLKVVIMMEGARVPSLTRALDIAAEVQSAEISFTGVIERLVARANDLEQLIDSLASIVRLLEQTSQALDELELQTRTHVDLSRDTSAMLTNGIHGAAARGAELTTPLRLARDELEGLQKHLSTLDAIGTRWTTLEPELRDALARSSRECGVPVDSVPTDQALCALVERFTLASHKRLAGDLDPSLCVEQGDSGGELTFF